MPIVTGDSVTWAVLACGVIVLAAEPPTIALLRRRGMLDVPGVRSSHSAPTPRGGGAPVALGLLAAASVAIASGIVAQGLAFALAIGFFGLLGLADDLRGLPAVSRLSLQTAGAAVVAALLVVRLPLSPYALALAAVAVACWLVGFVNAFNFMDGVNGISGGRRRRLPALERGPGAGLPGRRGELLDRRGPRGACGPADHARGAG
jgi:UDP-N-acetylmuramyl pentapeptide phosphotransferase/UDP-N-acetylglucosamine-1-phosphate transferase